MGFFQKLISRFFTEQKEITVSILGPSQAGKTTLVKYLETGEVQEDEPLSTLGVDYRNKPVEILNFSLNIIDVGGQKIYQDAFWDFSVEQSDGLVYVIDSTVKPGNGDFEKHLQQFDYVLNILPADAVLLILLNKQDLVDQDPINMDDFNDYYSYTNLAGKSFTILPISAKYGDGVQDSFDWFVQAIKEKQ